MLIKKSVKYQDIAVSRHTFQTEARSRSYTVVLPKVQQKSAPLLFVFHGSNQTGEKMRAFSGNVFDELVQERGFVVVYPNGYKGHWNDARVSSNFPTRKANIDDVGFTKALIDEMSAKHSIDANKVYIAGYSNGGQMVIRRLFRFQLTIRYSFTCDHRSKNCTKLVKLDNTRYSAPGRSLRSAEPSSEFPSSPARPSWYDVSEYQKSTFALVADVHIVSLQWSPVSPRRGE